MIREYDTHRIPDDAIVDWENEYLTYCSRCKKDIIVSNDMPKMQFYCKNCRQEILIESGQSPEHNHKTEDIIKSKMKPLMPSNRCFSRAVVSFMFALLALIMAVLLQITKTTSLLNTTWIVFGVFSAITVFFSIRAFVFKLREDKSNADNKPYEKI